MKHLLRRTEYFRINLRLCRAAKVMYLSIILRPTLWQSISEKKGFHEHLYAKMFGPKSITEGHNCSFLRQQPGIAAS